MKTPIFIISFNRLFYLKKLIESLEKHGLEENIVIIDNNSTYPPILEYLSECKYEKILLDRNYGNTVLFDLMKEENDLIKKLDLAKNRFVLTDNDVVPREDCPIGFMDHFSALMDKYPEVRKVGFGLEIEDIPATSKVANNVDGKSWYGSVKEWEGKFWTNPIEPNVFKAPIDTTFALYREGVNFKNDWDNNIRTGYPYVARHLPWYQDENNLSDEDIFYFKTLNPRDLSWSKLTKEHLKF